MKKEKVPKKRSDNYEPLLKIEGDFDTVMKAIIKTPKSKKK